MPNSIDYDRIKMGVPCCSYNYWLRAVEETQAKVGYVARTATAVELVAVVVGRGRE